MIQGLDHIAVAVSDLNEAAARWCDAFNTTVAHREIVAEQKVEIAMILVGTLRIELVCPTSPDSPIAKYIKKYGEGIHHFALTSDSTQGELDRLKDRGVDLIDETARKGAVDSRIGFIHPRSLGSVLVEIVDQGK
jgi:methylmalonyl-CoA/ethylmalonyl-CoA epimerase